MPASPPTRPIRRPRSAAAIAGSLILMITAGTVPATARPNDAQLGFRADGPTTTAISLGAGDSISTSTSDGRTTVLPLPRADGSDPGLLLSSSAGSTTVQATDTDAAPTVLSGHPETMITRAAEPVELHLKAIGRDGRQAGAHVSIFDVTGGEVQASRQLTEGLSHDCTAANWAVSDCVLLPAGTYSIMAFVQTNPAGTAPLADSRTAQSVALVGDPETKITGDDSFTFDARTAKPITVDTPGHRTKINPGGAMQLGYRRTAADGQQLALDYRPSSLIDETFYLQPSAPVTVGELDTLTRLRLEAPDITMRTVGLRPKTLHPAYYDPVWFSDFASDWPTFDGAALRRVVDVGRADTTDLAGRQLHGAIAVAERSDDLSVAEQSNAAAGAGASMIVIYNDGPGDNDDPNGTGVKISIPTLRVDHAEGKALTRMSILDRVAVSGEDASPYLYDLVIKEHDRIPRDQHYRYGPGDLTTQRREIHGQPSIDSTFSEASYQFQPEDTFSISTVFPFRDGPRSRTEYRLPDPDTAWSYSAVTPESSYNALFPHEDVLPMLLSDPQRVAYRPHQRVDKPIGTAPITASPNVPVQRAGDQMRIVINGFADADGNRGQSYSTDSGMSTLLQIKADDQLIGETTHLPSGVAQLPARSSKINISFRSDNPQPWAQLSSHTETSWTFESDSTDGTVRTEPLILTDYDVATDLRNRLGKRSFELGLLHQDGSTAAPFTTVELDASYDDGDSWAPVKISKLHAGTDRYRITLPAGNGPVSLRLHAEDAEGSSLDQTTIRAFWVR
ncbi:PA domain-containing protein [Microlunatus soli]|uniref:PA domain-containing protein n=1 Tax=Microlunatus soli TaxID=630515 RepID=A0A1H1YGZ0_9ACTN|nr:PA domain-containing protein [Microlunatus soli]SDT20703.1 PA domain-containing protein [Microlunatus soli]